MPPVDWARVTFTEHMTEAAAVVGECHIVLDFPPDERATYAIKVYAALKGGTEPYFAVGTNVDDLAGYHPVGGATTAEDAVQACLASAGIHHRRRVKQAGG